MFLMQISSYSGSARSVLYAGTAPRTFIQR